MTTAREAAIEAITRGMAQAWVNNPRPGEHPGHEPTEAEIEVCRWEAPVVLDTIEAAGLRVLVDQPDHYVTFDSGGWFVEHSLECRAGGTIGTCEFNRAAHNTFTDYDSDMRGRWRMTAIVEGLPDEAEDWR